MMPRLPATKQHSKGVALLAALILIMGLVLILGTIFYRHQIDVSRLSKMLHRDQALLMALSVESWAGQLLASRQDDRAVDSLEENWALAVPVLPVDGGFIRGCLIDLQGRVNLNSFSTIDTEDWLAEIDNGGNGLVSTWLSLLNYLKLPSDEALAVSIIDWVDDDTIALNDYGAEQINYDAARSSVIVANAPLSDPGELSVIRGYDLNMVQQLSPILSALPRPTPININTAPEILLLAMGGIHAENFSDSILQSRPFDSIATFRQSLSDTLGLSLFEISKLWPDDFVSIKSDYFQLNLQVTLGEATIEINSIMGRYNRDDAIVISRSVSVIPSIIPGSLSASEDEPLAPAFCGTSDLTKT